MVVGLLMDKSRQKLGYCHKLVYYNCTKALRNDAVRPFAGFKEKSEKMLSACTIYTFPPFAGFKASNLQQQNNTMSIP